MKFRPIMDQELPNGTHLITLDDGTSLARPAIWTVVVTTDGMSDRVISPTGEIITPGPADGEIPHAVWGLCSQVLS